MAQLMGCQLKSVKTFNGMEGLAFQANLYIDGKRAGTCCDYGDGGCLDIRMGNKTFDIALNEKRKAYFAKYPNKDFENTIMSDSCAKKSEDVYDNDMFINEIFNLWEIERYYKKMMKKGYFILVYEKYPLFQKGQNQANQMVVFSGNTATALAKKYMVDKQDKYPCVNFQVFAQPEDFNIG